MNQNDLKQAAAQAALDYIEPRLDDWFVIGVGTGSTTNFFIEALGKISHKIKATVSSSEGSAKRLKELGIPVFDLNSVDEVSVYVDGADEANEHLQLIKGGGAALTREKIVAAVALEFICIIDQSKLVPILGQFPLPIEVIPMARSYVARQLVKFGDPVFREGCITDNGNQILDVYNLKIINPRELEQQINQITGVVCNGLFAVRPADRLLIAGNEGTRTLLP